MFSKLSSFSLNFFAFAVGSIGSPNFNVGKKASKSKDFKSLRKQNHKLWEDIQKEDVGIIQRMQLGRNSHAYNGGNFSPDMDNPTHQFHKWVATNIV